MLFQETLRWHDIIPYLLSCISYEALLLEEQTVAQEITAFERKLDSWTSIPRAQHMKLTSAASGGTGEPLAGGKPEPSAMPPAVLAFQVREGGVWWLGECYMLGSCCLCSCFSSKLVADRETGMTMTIKSFSKQGPSSTE